MSEPLTDEALRKQYELVVQEYRFQVQLNWDRAKQYAFEPDLVRCRA